MLQSGYGNSASIFTLVRGVLMLKSQVEIGKVYVAKISGRLARVQIDGICFRGGWYATNLDTGRKIRIRGATKLRRLFSGDERLTLQPC